MTTTGDREPLDDASPFRAPRRLLWLALVVHLCLAGWYAFLTPAYEGPDENDHVYYAYFLHSTGRMPVIKGTAEGLGRTVHDEAVLAHHPPLYYLIESPLCGDRLPSWRLNPAFGTDTPSGDLHKLHGADETEHESAEIAALRRMRFISVLCGLVSVALTWFLGRQLWPERPAIAGVAALLLACVPEWSWMHGTVENGNLATTLALGATVLLLGAVRIRAMSVARGAWIGVLVGAALLTKLTSIFLGPLCVLCWLIALVRWPDKRRTLIAGCTALGVIVAISGWFFVRNVEFYGEVLALEAHARAFQSNQLSTAAAATGRSLADVRWEYLTGEFLTRSMATAVAGFGWRAVPVPFAEWLGIGMLALALGGWVTRGRDLLRGRGDDARRAAHRGRARRVRIRPLQLDQRPAAGSLPVPGLRAAGGAPRRRCGRAVRSTPAATTRCRARVARRAGRGRVAGADLRRGTVTRRAARAGGRSLVRVVDRRGHDAAGPGAGDDRRRGTGGRRGVGRTADVPLDGRRGA